MDISAIIKAVMTPQGEKPPGLQLDVKPGDQLAGKVLEIKSDGWVLMDLAGTRALAQIDVPVEQGQILNFEMIKNGPVMHLRTMVANDGAELPTEIKAVLASDAEGAGKPLKNLAPGEMLNGKVIAVKDNGRAVVDLGGSRRAEAQIDFPVKAGQHLKLEVIDNKTVLHLRAVTPISGDRDQSPVPRVDFSDILTSRDQHHLNSIIRDLTSDQAAFGPKNLTPNNVKNALIQIQSLFEKLPAERPEKQIAQWLKSAVEERGVLFEKRMADLFVDAQGPLVNRDDAGPEPPRSRMLIRADTKSQLMLLKDYLVSNTGEHSLAENLRSNEINFLRTSVERLLGHIEKQQERAVARWADGDTGQVFVHMLPLPDQKEPLKLKLYYPRKSGREEKGGPHRIALLLDMDRLGPVRIDLAMVDRQLRIEMFVRNEDTREFIVNRIHQVESSLKGLFDGLQIEVFVSKEKIQQFVEEDAAASAAGRIDLKI